ncbi:MAG: phosphohistidine phosphatase SixA [Corallincola sp.]|nr:phosphohistidine phosphatase SixA [Corallincola sp.]
MTQAVTTTQIYIMRHGQAEELAGRDRDRALTREGQQETREIARWLAVQERVPTHALVSPYLRARQTFDLVNHELRLPARQVSTLDELTPHGDPALVRDYLFALNQQRLGAVLIVAHMPLVSFLVELLDPRQVAPMFPTSGLALVRFDGDRGDYRGLRSPTPAF